MLSTSTYSGHPDSWAAIELDRLVMGSDLEDEHFLTTGIKTLCSPLHAITRTLPDPFKIKTTCTVNSNSIECISHCQRRPYNIKKVCADSWRIYFDESGHDCFDVRINPASMHATLTENYIETFILPVIQRDVAINLQILAGKNEILLSRVSILQTLSEADSNE